MRVRRLSSAGDMTFGASGLNFLVNSPECVAQVVKTSLELWEGQWSFDITQGFPLLQGILGKQSQATADLTVQNYIEGIEGVTDIIEYASSQDRTTRNFVSRLTIETEFSTTPIEVEM